MRYSTRVEKLPRTRGYSTRLTIPADSIRQQVFLAAGRSFGRTSRSSTELRLKRGATGDGVEPAEFPPGTYPPTCQHCVGVEAAAHYPGFADEQPLTFEGRNLSCTAAFPDGIRRHGDPPFTFSFILRQWRTTWYARLYRLMGQGILG
jgi:hypothetical protein